MTSTINSTHGSLLGPRAWTSPHVAHVTSSSHVTSKIAPITSSSSSHVTSTTTSATVTSLGWFLKQNGSISVVSSSHPTHSASHAKLLGKIPSHFIILLDVQSISLCKLHLECARSRIDVTSMKITLRLGC